VSFEQSYRLLLRAYPRRYRQVRGAEMLTTLMELAEPGRQRPTWRDGADLVLGALRYRFAPPRGRRYLILAAVNAIAFGIVFGSLAATLAWRVAQAQADRQLAPALVAEAGLSGALPTDENGGLALNGVPPAWLPVTREGADIPVGATDGPGVRPADLRDRLAAAGWQVDGWQVDGWQVDGWQVDGWQVDGTIPDNGTVIGFTAHRDGDAIRVHALELFNRDDAHLVGITYYHRRPAVVLPAAAGGLALGLLAGWLFATWLLRAWRAYGPRGRSWLVLAGGPVPVLELVLFLQIAVGLVPDSANDELTGRWPIVPILMVVGSPATLLILLGLAGSAAIAAAAPVQTPAPANPSGAEAR
jgi:hypothetical protein